jgi:poly(3-hydroxybutyrate) depolymerase
MRAQSVAIFLTLALAVSAAKAAPLPAPHQVDIPAASLTLHAQLFKPDGNGPFPTVIALHGCGGLAGHSEPVLPRYRDRAETADAAAPEHGHIGTDADARTDAEKRVAEWLAR